MRRSCRGLEAMLLQNRVTPMGNIVAAPERGLFTGNRGIIHDAQTRTLAEVRDNQRCSVCRPSWMVSHARGGRAPGCTGTAPVWRRGTAADRPPPLSAYSQDGANGISSSNFGVMPSLPLAGSRVACCSEERATSAPRAVASGIIRQCATVWLGPKPETAPDKRRESSDGRFDYSGRGSRAASLYPAIRAGQRRADERLAHQPLLGDRRAAHLARPFAHRLFLPAALRTLKDRRSPVGLDCAIVGSCTVRNQEEAGRNAMPNPERMTPIDAAWLRMDRPNNPMMIVGVMKLEGKVDPALVEDLISKRLLAHSRFRQFIDRTPTGWFWTDDPHFDLARHVRHVRLPAPGGKAALESFVAELASQPLDPNRPLWQFHLVEDYEVGLAVVSRIHNAIADGISLVRVMTWMTDEATGARGVEESVAGGQGGVYVGLGLGGLGGSLSSAIGQSIR